MDEYEGVVVLATNMKNNMDNAFARRMQYMIEFPFPDENSRFKIWRNIYPEKTPCDENIDFNFLSRNLDITGGNIKNIALSSAIYAAHDGNLVTMEHILKACKREYHKMGKIILKDNFGKYYDMVLKEE